MKKLAGIFTTVSAVAVLMTSCDDNKNMPERGYRNKSETANSTAVCVDFKDIKDSAMAREVRNLEKFLTASPVQK